MGLSFICQTGTPLLPLTVWRLQELQDVDTKASWDLAGWRLPSQPSSSPSITRRHPFPTPHPQT